MKTLLKSFHLNGHTIDFHILGFNNNDNPHNSRLAPYEGNISMVFRAKMGDLDIKCVARMST